MANTPFLDLVKPAGTDRALVSVINSNSDKIDTGVSTLSEQIASLNGKITTKTAISITPGNNIVIDENNTYYCGETIVIDFKCHATAAIGATQTIATLETPNSKNLKQNSIVPLFRGGEWSLTGVLYGYVNVRSISTNNIASGEYVHVYFTAFFA